MTNYKHTINASKWQLANQLEAQGLEVIGRYKNQWTIRDSNGNESEIKVTAHRDGSKADYVLA